MDGTKTGPREVIARTALNINQILLERLKDGSELIVTASVALDESSSGADATLFPVLRLRVSALLETFEFIPAQQASVGGSTIDTPYMDIAVTSGSPQALVSIYHQSESQDLRYAGYLHYTDNSSPPFIQTVELRLKDTYSMIEL